MKLGTVQVSLERIHVEGVPDKALNAKNGDESVTLPKTNHLRCSIPSCINHTSHNDASSLTFHPFPANKQLRTLWLQTIENHITAPFQVTSHTRVCSQHFSEEDFKTYGKAGRRLLKNNVVPLIFESPMPNKNGSQNDPNLMKQPVKRHELVELKSDTVHTEKPTDVLPPTNKTSVKDVGFLKETNKLLIKKRKVMENISEVENIHRVMAAKKRCIPGEKIPKLELSQLNHVPEIYFCAVPLCPNNSKQHPHLGFHLVPPRYSNLSDKPSMYHSWRDFLLKEMEVFDVSFRIFGPQRCTSLPDWTRICSVHFELRHFKAKPSLGLPGSQVELSGTAAPSHCVHHPSVKSSKERKTTEYGIVRKQGRYISRGNLVKDGVQFPKKTKYENSLLHPTPGNFAEHPIPIYNISFEDVVSTSDGRVTHNGKQIVFTQIAQMSSPTPQIIGQQQIVATNFLNCFGTMSSLYVVYSTNSILGGNQFVCEKLMQNYGVTSGQPYAVLTAFGEDPEQADLENVIDEADDFEPICFNLLLGAHMETHGCTDLEGVHCEHASCNDTQFKIGTNPKTGFPIFRNPRFSANGCHGLCQYCGGISTESGTTPCACSREKLNVEQNDESIAPCSTAKESMVENGILLHSEKTLYSCSHFNKSHLSSNMFLK